MKCPLCGARVHYQGLTDVKCAGSSTEQYMRRNVIGENCPNYEQELQPKKYEWERLSQPFCTVAPPAIWRTP